MQYKNNTLYTDLKEVSFDFPIKQVIKYRGMFIVLISPLENLEYPSNVFGVNNEGDIMWRIKSFNGEQIIFHSIEVNLENGKLYLKDFNHFKYIIDSETGEIVSGKIRPLEEGNDLNIKKSESKISKKLNLNLENKKLYLIILAIFGILILMLFSKNIKINSLENKIKKQEALIGTLENTLVKQEETLSKYEEAIKIIESNPNILQNIENTQSYQSYNEEMFPSSIETIEEETIQNTRENTSRKESVNNGVSTVIDFIDSVVGNVSSGTPTTIEDVNNSKSEINEGYIVSEIIDGQRIKISKAGENDFIVKLISVSNCSIETLNKIIPSGTQIYLETDSKKYNDNNELLAYVWVTEPNPDNLSSMVNYAVLKNNLATFVNESPNIKYNRYFF